ncbi:MAG: hypothetical protein Kow0090_03400 [Myxococcota bacterium]
MLLNTLLPHISILIFGIATMVIYGILTIVDGPRSVNIRLKESTSSIIPRWLMNWTYWVLEIPKDFLVRHKVSPNTLTIGGFLLSFGAALCFMNGYFATAGWLIIASGAFDIFDGWVARENNQISRSGGFLDSNLDRYGEIAIFMGLMFYYRDYWWIMMFCGLGIGSSMMVSYARARGEAMGIVYKKGFMQRYERMFYLAALATFSPFVQILVAPYQSPPFYYPAVLAIILISSLSFIGSIQRVWAIYHLIDNP